MFFWYKNSVLASAFGIAGGICGTVGVYLLFGLDGMEKSVAEGLLYILGGIALLIVGRIISDNKQFKKWWKQIEDNHLEPWIAESDANAFEIYKKNPQKRTAKKIAEINPSAGAKLLGKELKESPEAERAHKEAEKAEAEKKAAEEKARRDAERVAAEKAKAERAAKKAEEERIARDRIKREAEGEKATSKVAIKINFPKVPCPACGKKVTAGISKCPYCESIIK